MQFSHASMSSSSRRRPSDSSELDVFDASRYFSGCIDGISVGFGYNSTNMSCHSPIAMKKSLEMMASLPCQKVESSITEEKKSKQPISPGRKLAIFLNSLFQKTPSKKKKKQKSMEQVADQSHGGRRESSEHKGKKLGKSFKSFNSSFGENKWLLRRNGDEFMVRKREEDGMREEEERDEKNAVDHESDSSSDLFELKSYDFSDFNYGLPVYQTSKTGAKKRGASVFASVAF